MSSTLKGFCHPFTPGGKSQLLGPPPWHYSMDQMVINYNADPDQVARYIPLPLEPSIKAPGGCSVRITAMTSVSGEDPEMMFTNPERCIFNEAIISINCSYRGAEGQKIVYMWVDNDFTLMRGWFIGSPKKLGRVVSNFEKRQYFSSNPGLSDFGPGTKLKGWAEAQGERLVSLSMTLGDRIPQDQLPPAPKMEIYNIVHFPNIEIGATRPLAHRLVKAVDDVKMNELWRATDAKATFHDSEVDEHTDIKPIEITGASFMNMSITIHGNELVYDYNQQSKGE